MVAQHKPYPELTLQQQVERLSNTVAKLLAHDAVADARLAALERLCAKLGATPPTIGDEWTTTKLAADATGYSQSQIRKWIKSGRVAATRVGGRILIRANSLPPQRGAK